MTEIGEQEVILKSPLDAVHQRLGATMVKQNGWSVPGSYGDVLFEYASVRESGAGLIDQSSRGRIRVGGSEAVQFLNGLITNDMKTLSEDRWMAAAFPNFQGRLIASVRVIRLTDDETGKKPAPAFLIDTEAATYGRVLKTIERFTLAGDFQVSDVTDETAHITVQGTKASQIISEVFGRELADVAPAEVKQIVWPATEPTSNLIIVRANHTGEDGFDLIVNAHQAANLWKALHEANARPVGYQAFEMLRIEAGIPRYGIDMDETNVVTEAALDQAVSYTKGCYVGQEIIARIKYRGHVAKKLSGVSFDQAEKVEPGMLIQSTDGKEIGRITSVTYSPHLGRTIALGYLKYDYLGSGTSLKIITGGQEITAQVVELPFVGKPLLSENNVTSLSR